MESQMCSEKDQSLSPENACGPSCLWLFQFPQYQKRHDAEKHAVTRTGQPREMRLCSLDIQGHSYIVVLR